MNAPDVPAIRDGHRIVPRRSLLLCAAGAVIGLLIAGFGLFTAQGTRTASVPPENAAIVNGVPVLRADLIAQVRTLYEVDLAQATRVQKRQALDDMIREELYVQRGVEMGLPNDDIDVRAALVGATEAQVAQDARTALPAEAELRAWYAAHPALYATQGTMTLHEWIVPDATTAARAVAALRGGADPRSLTLRSSGRVDDGEEFYFAARIHLGDTLFRIARGMRDGEVADPVAAGDGHHLLQMVRNRPPRAIAFDEARDKVLRDFLADKIARLQRGNERFLRKRADVTIAADLR